MITYEGFEEKLDDVKNELQNELQNEMQNEMQRETDLHAPVKLWLQAQGCEVKTEVKTIDMVGLYHEDFIIAIELKLKLNLEVINQAVERQGIADLTYIAVVHDYKAVETKRFKMTLLTLKRLNIGLLLVNFRASEPIVVEVLKPENFDFERSRRLKKGRREQLIAEFNKRHGDFNKAGSHKTKLMTGYKEQCLLVAHYMYTLGHEKAKSFEKYGIAPKKVASIFTQNYYNWFVRRDKGIYGLSDDGLNALIEFSPVVEFLLSQDGVSNEA